MAKQPIHDFITQLIEKIESTPNSFLFAVFSAPCDESIEIKRVRIRPIIVKGSLHYQVSSFTKTQCFTVNVMPSELRSELFAASERYTQLVVRFMSEELHAHIEEGNASFKVTQHKKVYLQDLAHNRQKKYLVDESEPSELLQELGIQTQEGKIRREMFDKFKQINRFLEIISDILPELGPEPQIVDFGCGKAYLTFALKSLLPQATITGIDARGDVVEKSLKLAERLKLSNLHFRQMRIEEYQSSAPVDVVLALHACDTATDDALAKAIQLQAKTIFVAPCCQHEVASQIKKDTWPLLLKHGLLKERFSALVTDALRAEILEQLGYSVDMIEFIDPEHTPKNLLIRATRKKNPPPPDLTAYRQLSSHFGIHLKLEKLIDKFN